MVSVIIPFKNASESIQRALKSVSVQSFKDWECLLIDDMSTDGSIDCANSFAVDDARFRCFKGGGGANACRNIGLREATFPFVVFLDADDQLKPMCLAERLEFFREHADCDVIISQTAIYTDEISKSSGCFRPLTTNADELLLGFVEHKIPWNTTGPTWKRSFLKKIGGWNEEYPRLQDVELNIRALLHGPKIALLDRKDSYYHSSSFTDYKRYDAQFGFLYLLRDYYPIIKQRFINDTERLGAFQSAFKKSVMGIKIAFDNRGSWYNPYFMDLLVQVVADKPELADCKCLDEYTTSDTSVFEVSEQNFFYAFLTEVGAKIQQQLEKNYSLSFGIAGNLLFLFYSQHAGVVNVDRRFIQKVSRTLFMELKKANFLIKQEYWIGVAGILHVFEVLDKNGLVDTDIRIMFHNIDLAISETLIKSNCGGKDDPFLANVLLSRVRHYNRENNLGLKSAVIQVVENVLKGIDNNPINIYELDYFPALSLLNRVYQRGWYKDPIKQIVTAYSKKVEEQLDRYPITIQAVNNVFGLLKCDNIIHTKAVVNKLNHIVSKLELSGINLKKPPVSKIDVSYLTFINNLINCRRLNPHIDFFLRERFYADIRFTLALDCQHRIVHGGVIGISGVALSLISYLYPDLRSWDEILMIAD